MSNIHQNPAPPCIFVNPKDANCLTVRLKIESLRTSCRKYLGSDLPARSLTFPQSRENSTEP